MHAFLDHIQFRYSHITAVAQSLLVIPAGKEENYILKDETNNFKQSILIIFNFTMHQKGSRLFHDMFHTRGYIKCAINDCSLVWLFARYPGSCPDLAHVEFS